MKILMISTPIFAIPLQGYGGLEELVYRWSVEFAKAGHNVSVVAPEGSQFPPELNIELIGVPLRCSEEQAYMIYKDRLKDFDVVEDNSWLWYSLLSQMEADHQLPIVHCYHSDPGPSGGMGNPTIRFPCILAFSEAQANIIRSRFQCTVQVAHHGIDLDFYKPDPTVQRGDRYLFLARYCPEKGFLEVSYLAKKCKVGLDAFGDTEIIGPNEAYMRKCFEENDGRLIKVNPGLPRSETAKQYQSHRALITWPNFVEIFGLTTIEAMACGCPVISKDSGAARELIKEGKTGFIVSTLEEVEELIKTDACAKLKPEDCRKQAQKFSIAASARKHLGILQDAANGLYW